VPKNAPQARPFVSATIATIIAIAAVTGFALTAFSASVAGAAGTSSATKAARQAAAAAKAEARAEAKAAKTTSPTATAATSKAASTSQFQVCNLAGAPNLDGVSFPFVEGTWSGSYYTTYSLTAEPAPGTCGPKHSMTAGSVILVEQASSPGAPVPGYSPSFAVSNGTLDGVVSNIAFAMVTVGTGVTTLNVTDVATPPTQNGTLELCKYGSDQYVRGSFNFNITGPGFSSTQTVPTGQCNDVVVPATNLSITEPSVFPYALASVAANPSSALVSSNLDTQSAVVSVSPGGTSTVSFTNSTLTAYTKVCKTLDRSQDNVLAGQTFTYVPTANFEGTPISGLPASVSVTATPFGTTTCSFLANKRGADIALPLGTLVTYTEDQSQYPTIQSVNTTVSPANLNAGSTNAVASLYVGNLPAPSNIGNLGSGSVTQATFTNEAFGYVEICKTSNQGTIQQGEPFTFSVAGVGTTQVEVNYCSMQYPLPVGTVAITEFAQPDISLAGVTSSIPGGVSLSGTTATATVPYAADNSVTFDNEVNKGSFKICMAQSSPDANLENTQFPVSYSYTVNGTAFSGSSMLYPGQCTLPVTALVLNKDLSHVRISVTEGTTPVADVELSAYGVVPNSASYSPPTVPHLLSSPGGGSPATGVITNTEGTTVVTFTNGRTAT
jgi:hypothetical protein